MAQTRFSGPVKSNAGFIAPVVTTANLPVATTVPAGTVYIISDNGVGNNEYCPCDQQRICVAYGCRRCT